MAARLLVLIVIVLFGSSVMLINFTWLAPKLVQLLLHIYRLKKMLFTVFVSLTLLPFFLFLFFVTFF